MRKRAERYITLGPALAALATALFMLSACAAPTPNPFALANTKWTLTEMTRNSVSLPVVAVAPTLEFQSDTLGGNAGCNSYGGDYKTQGEMIQVSALRSTLMACADANAMAQESAYLGALQNARMFEVRENRLRITTANGSLGFGRK